MGVVVGAVVVVVLVEVVVGLLVVVDATVSGVLVKVQTTCAPVFPEAAGKSRVKPAPEPFWSDVVPLRHAYVVPYVDRFVLLPGAADSDTV